MADRWKFNDSIMILEARAMVKAAKRVSNSRTVSDLRVLILGDNLGVVLAFGRSRARKFELLIQIRRLVSLGLARGIRFYYRWVPSEFNSADFGSRLFDAPTRSQPCWVNLLFAAMLAIVVVQVAMLTKGRT